MTATPIRVTNNEMIFAVLRLMFQKQLATEAQRSNKTVPLTFSCSPSFFVSLCLYGLMRFVHLAVTRLFTTSPSAITGYPVVAGCFLGRGACPRIFLRSPFQITT